MMKSKKSKLITFLRRRVAKLNLVLLVMVCVSPCLSAQNSIINGTVKDEAGTGLIGVTVQLNENAKIGAITDFNGKFTLSVPVNSQITFSYIGYESQTVPAQSNLLVIMKEDSRKLDEVVVVGYGTQRKVDLTGSVTSIKADKIKGLANANAAEALQGKPGLFVLANGSPGAAPTVRIRGIGTNGDASPLYVVDGMMVNSIQYLNNNDVESMDVLKDASATAIYGSRGANGVIMITTKQGKKGKPVVTYSGSEGYDFKARTYDVCDASEFARLSNIVAENAGTTAPYANPSSYGKGTNWLNEITRNGQVRDHQLSLSGGSESVNYNLSVGYYSQEGIFKDTHYDRFTTRLNNDYKINKSIKVGHNFAFTNANSGQDLTYRTLRSVFDASPLITSRNESGVYNSMQNNELINPVAELELNKDYNYQENKFVGNAWGTWDILDGLTFRTSAGLDWTSGYRDQFKTAYSINGSFQFNPKPTYEEYYSSQNTWLLENTLNYNKTINKIHRISLLAGYSAEKTHTKGLGANAYGYAVSDLDYATISAASASTRTVLTEAPGTQTRASYISRVNYALKDRYLLTATLRADGSSKFGTNNKWGYFPSAALGWRISEESFLKKLDWLNNLKLRGSWGQTGNDKITNNVSYPLVSQIDEFHAVYNGVYAASAMIFNASNPNIKWERTEQLDCGFDANFLNNRLSLEFDYFNRDTKDLLMILPIAGGSAGISPTYSNVGSVRNRGYEFTIRWQDGNKDFKYGIALSGSSFKNNVLDWGGQVITNNIFSTFSYNRIEKGQPLNYFYGYDVVGIYRTQADIDKLNASAVSKGKTAYHSVAKLGDAIFRDVNNDGTITADDRTNIGNPYPDFTGDLSFNAAYKGFDLSFDLSFSYGAKIMNSFYSFYSDKFNMHSDWLNSWTPTNTTAALPRLASNSIISTSSTSLDVSSADYTKLRNLELGYTLPKTFTEKLKIKNLRVYVNASNLIYLSKYKGLSPEVGGVDSNSYPLSGNARVGVNLTF